jgi:hypothetical protein
MPSRIKTDYDEVVVVDAEPTGDVVLSIVHGIGSTDCVLRPMQAERLAEQLLAYANGDNLLPPDAVRPQRVVTASETPAGEALAGTDTPAIPPRPPMQPPGHQREMADTPAEEEA